MPVQVKLSASLRQTFKDYDPVNGLMVDPEPGLTVGRVMDRLEIPVAKVKIIMVNGLHAQPEKELADGDRLSLFPAVGGG